MKKALQVIGIALFALIAVYFGGGLLIKPQYQVERSLLINAPAERIYGHLDSAAGWQRWGVWYRRDPQMQQTTSGPERGVGARWKWKSQSQGDGGMTLTAAEPSQRVAYELRIDGFEPSTGELRLQAEGQGTRITWVMQGDMGTSVLGRWFTLVMDRMVGPDFEAGLAHLKQVSENH